jgi:glutamine amidotransferase
MIAIVDYNAGNLRSVERACRAVGVDAAITRDPEALRRADRIIFPGVGAAPSAVASLHASGLFEALREAYAAGTPLLGICVGTQLALERSEEGDTPGLAFIEGATVRFAGLDATLKVPHIGWNAVQIERPHPLLEGIRDGDEFYFVHSYYPKPAHGEDVYATTCYGVRFCSALGRENLFATQFHPEKSGRFGLGLLERFAKWSGSPC